MNSKILIALTLASVIGLCYCDDICVVQTVEVIEEKRQTTSLSFLWNITDGAASGATSQCEKIELCWTKVDVKDKKCIPNFQTDGNETSSWLHKNLTSGTQYTLKFTATPTDGDENSEQASAFTLPAPPENIAVVHGVPAQSVLLVSWKAPAGQYDKIEVLCKSDTYNTTAVIEDKEQTEYNCTGLEPHTEYIAKVRTIRGSDKSDFEEAVASNATVACDILGTKSLCCAVDVCVMTNCTDEDKCVSKKEKCDGSSINWCLATNNESSTIVPPSVATELTTQDSNMSSSEPDQPTPTPDAGNASTTVKPTNATVKPTNATVTPTNATVPTPVVTTTTTTASHDITTVAETENKGRKFDAASFIGGMVLMLGVLLIIFFACKYYKSRTETRYRQF